MIETGKGYEKNKRELIKGIKKVGIEGRVVAPEKPRVCYFCSGQIRGRGREISAHEQIRGREMKSNFYVHEACYQGILHPQVFN